MRALAALLVAFVLVSAPSEEPTRFATLRIPELVEASGLAASPSRPGVYWALNDSAGAGVARNLLYAFDARGELLAAWEVTGATNIDWEDLGALPGRGNEPGALIIADIGDTSAERRENRYTLYRVREPAIGPPQQPARGRVAVEQAWSFRYPDRRRDAESLLVDPKDGSLYVVEKPPADAVERQAEGDVLARCGVYEIPTASGESPATAVLRTTLAIRYRYGLGAIATGGAVAPDRSRVAVRTYRLALVYPVPAGRPLWEAFLRAPRRIELPFEPQGEAIAFEPQGHALLTLSEAVFGWNSVWRIPLPR